MKATGILWSSMGHGNGLVSIYIFFKWEFLMFTVFFLCPVQVCLPVGDMSGSGSQLGSMGSLTMKSQLQITGKS